MNEANPPEETNGGLLNWSAESKEPNDRELIKLSGMTTIDERVFYSEMALVSRNTCGSVVDLGCWMGSTSMSLAKGLLSQGRDNTVSNSSIYAYDTFVWQKWMDVMAASVCCDYLPGDSFLPEVRRRIRAYQGVVHLIKADLETYKWEGGPIKLLLVDVMKNWSLTKAISSTFFPSMRKGGILIHQDFKHYYTPWIHIFQFRLRNAFGLIREIENGSTVAFEVVREIAAQECVIAADFATVTEAELEEVFQYSASLVGDMGKEAIAAAHIMYYVHKGRLNSALRWLTRYREIYKGETIDMRMAHAAVTELQ